MHKKCIDASVRPMTAEEIDAIYFPLADGAHEVDLIHKNVHALTDDLSVRGIVCMEWILKSLCILDGRGKDAMIDQIRNFVACELAKIEAIRDEVAK